MTKATITPTCGLTTTVDATAEDMQRVTLQIESECAAIRKLAAEIPTVNPFHEMSRHNEEAHILTLGREHCSHTSCPVPSALIKAAEIAAGMDLPKPVVIEFTND
jgi:hypothetical protein